MENTINAINELVNDMNEILEVAIPVDIEDLVSTLRGELIYVDNLESKESKIEQVDTLYYGFKITIPKPVSELEKRLVLAHKLGHLFIHMGYLINEEKWETSLLYRDSSYYRIGYNIEEYEANEFSSALLMPKKIFFKIAKKNLNNDVYNIQEIASHFGIPIESAKQRGRKLGLFS